MADDDRIALMDEARKEAKDEVIDGVLFARAELVRPAIGDKRKPEEVLIEHERFVNVEGVAASVYDELQARFKLSREEPISLRFIYIAIAAQKALEKQRQKTNAEAVEQLPQQGFDIGIGGQAGIGGQNEVPLA